MVCGFVLWMAPSPGGFVAERVSHQPHAALQGGVGSLGRACSEPLYRCGCGEAVGS